MTPKDTIKIVPVILAGGGGTRLWPLSREHYPKQLLSFGDEASLLQKTLRRIDKEKHGLNGAEILEPLVICNQEHRFLVAEQAQEAGIGNCRIFLEPVGRNTAPALTVAALAQEDSNTVLVLMPADHLIEECPGFYEAIERAVLLASDNYIVTLGIKPVRPETGFGYIRHGEPLSDDAGACLVEAFTEKPDQSTAEQFLAEGNYSWNGGLFIVSAANWLAAIGELAPSMLASCREAYQGRNEELDFVRLEENAFTACPSDSIDYAVMEKLDQYPGIRAAVVKMDAGWSDIGSWDGFWQIMDKDEHGNVIHGDGLVIDSRHCMISSQRRLVSALGVENLVIIETTDAVLVTNRDCAQDVKQVVEALKAGNRNEHLHHQRVYRPWGSYESIDSGEAFQVKRLTVNPGQKLSLQKHHHRAEHWVVVQGIAEVTRDEDVFTLEPNQSTYIPIGAVHRLANPGDVPLEVIEVQSGDYLGEDDIVRFEDVYNRN
ncbi:MAG: mannose-1-phosphate guanylyltransferase/mannose-6-phosphate isomerase [Gammaproteobacteria bacterium]